MPPHSRTRNLWFNYWAYNPIGLLAPKRRYGAASATGGQVAEFKQMVRELHAAASK